MKVGAIKRAEWITAILLSLTVLFLLIVRAIHAGALWRDECGNVQLAQMPSVADVLKFFAHQTFPPLVPLTIRVYAALFGTSEASLRCFGFAMGFTLVGAAWFNARTRNEVPLVLLALLGLNTTFLVWGTTVSTYGIGSVLLVFAIGLIAKLLRQPTASRIAAVTLASVAAVQLLINDLVLVLAICFSAMLACLIRRSNRLALAFAGIALCSVLSDIGYLKKYAAGDWRSLLEHSNRFSSYWKSFALACGNPTSIMPWLWCLTFLAGLIGGVWFLSTRSRSKLEGESPVLLFGVLGSVIAPLAYYASLRSLNYSFYPRHYLPLISLLAANIDLIVAPLCRIRWVRLLRLVSVIAAVISLPLAVWPKVMERQTNIDLVAQKLQQDARASDLIVINPWFLGISFNWYYHGTTPWLTLPAISEHRIHRYDLVKMKMMSPIPIDDVIDAMKQTLKSGNRVWLVGGAHMPQPGTTPLSLPPAPNSQFRWNADAYARAWSQQIAMFAQDHALHGEFPDPMGGLVNEFEKIPLWMVEGWRD